MGKSERRITASPPGDRVSERGSSAKKSPGSHEAGEGAKRALKVWHAEIDTLSNRKFSSLSEAIDCVVEQVGNRMNATEEERDFLRITIGSDPGLCAELRRELRIK